MIKFYKLAIILIFLITTSLVAQQADGVKDKKWQRYMLPGKVVSISNDKQSASLIFYVRANSPDAAGKIPDEMVRKIADLREAADKIQLLANARLEEARRLRESAEANNMMPTIIKIEKKGNDLLDKSRKINELMNEMMCWRLREYILTAKSTTQILTRSRFSIETVALDNKVLVVGNTLEKLTKEHPLPEKVVLLENVIEVINKNRSNGIKIGELPAVREKKNKERNKYNDDKNESQGSSCERQVQMVEIIGTVSSVNPLMISVNGKNIIIENPSMYGYEKSAALSYNDIRTGISIIGQFDTTKNSIQENLTTLYLMAGSTSLFGQDGDFANLLNTMQKLQL